MFEQRWWDDRILSLAMNDEAIKVQLFRFVDVLPKLRDHTSVTRHLHEYFEEAREHMPWAARLGLDLSKPDTILGRAVAINARSSALRMARRFIAGANAADVLRTVSRLRKRGLGFTLDLLGEAIISEREADTYLKAYTDLIAQMSEHAAAWSHNETLDRDHERELPRVNVSVKLSALYSQFAPIDPEGTANAVKRRLRQLLRCAQKHHGYVHVDMEQYAYKDLTFRIFKETLLEEEFRELRDVGIVVQAYLPDARADLVKLLDWVKRRGTPVWVRLVKGAYWDYETVHARAHGWPVPVFLEKWQSDANFELSSQFLLENYQLLRPAFASHNLRSLAHAIGWADVLKVPKAAYELQLLYGMGEDQADLFVERGHRVRAYVPFGELIPGMGYLVRRLLENTSNDSFLRHSFAEHVSAEELFMKPERPQHSSPQQSPPEESAAERPPATVPAFKNEPLSDFSRQEPRTALAEAVDDVSQRLGHIYPLVIDGARVRTDDTLVSVNPSEKAQVVGRVCSAQVSHAEAAIASAKKAFSSWARTPPAERVRQITTAAELLKQRRFELAAWQVFECGKPWAEADADVVEAIDFCQYYSRRMLELSRPRRRDVPGEDNAYFYRPRGVTVVIAPWNFPLAILAGMTVAALVTGNTVVMKPAEQSSVVAAKWMEVLESADLPPGVVQFLPGVGEAIGPRLVTHPDVRVIAFTGSRAVGLSIHKSAAATTAGPFVKQVIAEMGGKNAIIVDDDADLDEAVAAVVKSAFGYAGQKCSACSRAIVLDGSYDSFVERVTEATRSLKVGPAVDPGTFVGPVIDEEAFSRIRRAIERETDGGASKLAVGRRLPALEERGYFIAPHVFVDADPDSALCQTEIFGPVLSVVKAKNLDDAFRIQNGTDYALTGGFFSRSPKNLKRAAEEMLVGNLYLNRGITGALVDRQPFGGFKMSGIGSKAGGPDYLLQYMLPLSVTENTLRRGFAPTTEQKV